MNELHTTVQITIDYKEKFDLCKFGYMEFEEFDDKEAITNAIHAIISDIPKMTSK